LRQLLSGIKVVELAEGVAGSYCGKLFADLGADVVKVERPPGDELRHRRSAARDVDGTYRGGAFLHLNTNKRSTVLDPESVDGRERLGVLIDRCGLVIESTGSGRLATWGYTWSGVHERAPGVSVVGISGFGATGPYAGYQWDDLTMQAITNNMVRGRTDESSVLGPVRFPGHLGLCIVGNLAALGALGAVMSAASTGVGSFIDCSAAEALSTIPARATTLL
jgi:crotonobetainyl-CoA:carnitine CoA-transferase CaiB-like acyl-CoA transferase